ncbi:MAG: nucleoside-diphosphate sugar epimerase/dehydratase [Pseudomonadota bacterium]
MQLVARYLKSLDSRLKLAILITCDAGLLIACVFASYWLRLSQFEIPPIERLHLFLIGPFIGVFALYVGKVYYSVSRSYSARTEWRIMQTQTAVPFLWAFFLVIFGLEGFPRSVLLVNWSLSILALIGWRRLIAKLLSTAMPVIRQVDPTPVIIFGAKETGARLSEILAEEGKMRPVAFADDDPELIGRRVSGLKVIKIDDIGGFAAQESVDTLLVAKPELSRRARRELVELLQPLHLEVRIVPDLADVASGQSRLSEMRPIRIQDLLGRDPVPPKQDLLDQVVKDQCVLITGAGGSIGSEIVRQVSNNHPRQIVLVESSEFNLFEIHREIEQKIKREDWDLTIHAVLGSVSDQNFMKRVFARWQVDIVFHAAAYKHVTMVEQNPGPAIYNNVLGTLYCAQSARDANVKRFVLISTDKAVNPTSLMGATKRVSELVVQAMARQETETVFTMVRFGNVLGSSGSVVPLFTEQIERGGPVTVTHPDVVRYFMLIPEAAQLVVQAAAMARGGEVFLLQMGHAVRILELARQMISLAGLAIKDEANPDGDIEITFTGLMPGEKLYEELFIGQNIRETQHERILLCDEVRLRWSEVHQQIRQLATLLELGNEKRAHLLVMALCELGSEDDSDVRKVA